MLRSILAACAAVLLTSGTLFAGETVKVASNPTWPPMEFLNAEKKIVGYDRDIMEAIAKEMGFSIDMRNTAWDGIFASLESAQSDVIASCVTITEPRKKNYLFSDPYYEVRQALVVARDSAISKPEDLKGKTIGVQIGTTAVEALRKMKGDFTIKTYDEVGLVFEDLRNGRLDAAMCDDPVARYYSSRKEGYQDLMKLAFVTDDVEYIGFVMRKDDTAMQERINKGLAAIRANGKEKAIRVKWLGE